MLNDELLEPLLVMHPFIALISSIGSGALDVQLLQRRNQHLQHVTTSSDLNFILLFNRYARQFTAPPKFFPITIDLSLKHTRYLIINHLTYFHTYGELIAAVLVVIGARNFDIFGDYDTIACTYMIVMTGSVSLQQPCTDCYLKKGKLGLCLS